MMMNNLITKKLKLSRDKVLYSLEKFGNTSSASIPITLVSSLDISKLNKKMSLVFCGFGVGLSWGSVQVEINKEIKLNIIEL